MDNLDKLFFEKDRLQAFEDCRNLMGAYATCWSDNRTEDIAGMFAEREDCSLEMPWGRYDGKKGVVRCFTEDHLDVRRGDNKTWLNGAYSMHFETTPLIEVAGDGQTARGVFISHGFETYATRNRREDYRGRTFWHWGKLGVDFILEDGQWKFWHFRLCPLVFTEYGKSWEEHKKYDGFGRKNSPAIDGPGPHPVYEWSAGELVPRDMPGLPEPYGTFAEVAPGYGYITLTAEGQAGC